MSRMWHAAARRRARRPLPRLLAQTRRDRRYRHRKSATAFGVRRQSETATALWLGPGTAPQPVKAGALPRLRDGPRASKNLRSARTTSTIAAPRSGLVRSRRTQNWSFALRCAGAQSPFLPWPGTIMLPGTRKFPNRADMAKNIVYFDLETQKSADEVGGWSKISRMGMSVGVTYSTARADYGIYGEQRVNNTLTDLQRDDRVVRFNVRRFGYRDGHGYTL